MTDSPSGVQRFLIIHPDDSTRQAVEESLRNVYEYPSVVYQAGTLPEGLQRSRQLEPNCVLVDLGSSNESPALDLVQELRRPGRLIIGLFDPLVNRNGSEIFRRAPRAGVGDFVQVPVADSELAQALVALREPESPVAEAPQGRVVSFFGAKGGVGATTLAVNTATALAAAHEPGSVVLCDADLQGGNATTFLGLHADSDLVDLVCNLDSASVVPSFLAQDSRAGLQVLASPTSLERAEFVAPEDLSRVVVALQRRFPLVVVDTSSTLDLATLAVLDLSDAIYVVTEAVLPTISATARVLRAMRGIGFGEDRVRVVVNRYSSSEGHLTESVLVHELGGRPAQVMPYDREVVRAASRGQPVVLGKDKFEIVGEIKTLAELVARDWHSQSR